jgi:IS5 family transposase
MSLSRRHSPVFSKPHRQEESRLRPKIHSQSELEFPISKLALTQQYYAKYQAISKILDQVAEILALAHGDLKHALEELPESEQDAGRFRFTSDQVLRILLVQSLEGFSLRQTVVRVDDSPALRQFTRLGHQPMMDFTTLCKLKNAIRSKTWKQINRRLAQHAVREERITGESLRLDTTAVETNIHWPTDSSLLWDSYRVLARLIERARELDPDVVGGRRLHRRPVRREALAIARKAAKRRDTEALKPLYRSLLERVDGICEWALGVARGLSQRIEGLHYREWEHAQAEALVAEIAEVHGLARRVIDQARRRVLSGESVPNDEKLFSVFEPHTELLKRGKAGKEIEFGHMIQIQQVDEKFITDYEVYARKPAEPTLLEPALVSHRALFGAAPSRIAADKGYYETGEVRRLERSIEMVSIAKKGSRTQAETEREHDPCFRHAQAFRAGIEGTISFLKRVLRLARCLNKGWEHFVATIGQTIFAHNLLVLARC